MKKFLSILIAVLLLVSALPVMAVSASDVVTYDVVCSEEELVNLSFTPQEDGYYVFYTACDEDTNMCLYGEDYMLWSEDVSEDNTNFRLKAKLEKGETYRMEVSTWSSDPCEFTVFVEPAENYVVSGEMVKTPDIDYAVEDAEYESIWLEGMEIEFTLSDGTKETYTYDYDMTLAMMHIDGSVVGYEQDDLSDTVSIMCDDAVVEWKYQVKPNPVDYMEYTGDPIQVVENTEGWYDEEEDVFFYDAYTVDDDDSFVVHYKDGTSEEIVIYDRMYNYSSPGIYPVILADDQYMVPWTPAGENFAFLYYLGKELAIPVEILPEGSEPDYPEEPEEPDYDYPEEPAEPVYLGTPHEVTLEDGFETYLEFTPEEDGYYLFYSTGDYDTYISVYDEDFEYYDYGEDATKDNVNFLLRTYLEKGKTYTLAVGAYDEGIYTFEVCVEPTDVYVVSGSITKNPDKNYVYEGAEFETLILDGMELTYNLSDGSTQTVVLDSDVFSPNVFGAPVEYEYNEDTNEVEFTCEDIIIIYSPEIVENPVESIEYTGDPLTVYEDDGWYDEEFENNYYVFWFKNDETIKVCYKDGTSEELIIEGENEYYIMYWTDQEDSPWTVGGENYVYIEYLDHTIEVPVELVAGSDPDYVEDPEDPDLDFTDGGYLIGDANSDGKINVKDATQIQKAIASLVTLDATQEAAADADTNGTLNIKDATAIQKYAAGMDTGLFIGNVIDPNAVG